MRWLSVPAILVAVSLLAGCAPVTYRVEPSHADRVVIDGFREKDGKPVKLWGTRLTDASSGRATGSRLHRGAVNGIVFASLGIALGVVGTLLGTVGAEADCRRSPGWLCGLGTGFAGIGIGTAGAGAFFVGLGLIAGYGSSPDAELRRGERPTER